MNENNLVGIFPDMPNREYHAHPALGSSGLKLLDQSPLHYWNAYRNPERAPAEDSNALRIGRACHTVYLEPHLIDDMLIVLPEDLDRRTKEGKILWAEILASGKEPITDKEWQQVSAMSRAAHSHPISQILFDRCNAQTEVSIFWIDPETGANCKIRPDFMVEPCAMFPDGLIADLKTTDDASPAGFAKSAWNWDMHLQAALYPEGFMATFKTRKPPAFLWLAQEKSAPYANAYYACPSKLSTYGRREVNRLRQIFAECLATDDWPGYSRKVQDILLPAWADRIVEQAAI